MSCPGDPEAVLASDTAALGHIALATDRHAASSMPGGPSGAGEAAVSETQKDPGSTADDYLATLHSSDGFLSGDKPGRLRHPSMLGGPIRDFTAPMECSVCLTR